MKSLNTRNGLLALAGLSALTIYILACTSFSPDDKRVLYPVFDTSGVFALAVYDREQKRSETVFTPVHFEEKGETNSLDAGAAFVRGEWLADGRRIAVVWNTGGNSAEDPMLALIPWGGRGEVRMFNLAPFKPEGPAVYMNPVCILKDRLFIVSEERQIVRIDLQTGEVVKRPFGEDSGGIMLYPSATGHPFYLVDRPGRADGAVFGRLDADSFARTPLITVSHKVAEMSFVAYDPEGTMLALLEEENGKPRLAVHRKGREPFTKSFPAASGDLRFGNAVFHPKGKGLVATCRETVAEARQAYSLWEIPLDDGPIRQTRLFEAPGAPSDETVLYFQAGISHDGKTVAVSSAFLAAAHPDLKPADCALFFVDLTDPGRKVSRVAIPVPKWKPELK